MTFQHWLCSLWHCVTLGHGRAWCHHDCHDCHMAIHDCHMIAIFNEAPRLQLPNQTNSRAIECLCQFDTFRWQTKWQTAHRLPAVKLQLSHGLNWLSTVERHAVMHHHAGLLAAVPSPSPKFVLCRNVLKSLEPPIDRDMVRYGALRPLLRDQSALAAEELQGQDAHALRGMSLASLSHFRIKTCPKQNYSTLLLSSHLFTRTCSEKFFHHFHPLPRSFYKSNFRQTSHAWCHHLTRWKQMTQWLLNEENSTMNQEIYEWPMQKTTWREWKS